MREAVVATSSTEYVTPVTVDGGSWGVCVREAHVDMFGNLVLRTADGGFVLVREEAWKGIEKLPRFAKKHAPKVDKS